MRIIAELGSNPAPGWKLKPYVMAAKFAGADIVKLQLFRAEHFPAAEQASKRAVQFPRPADRNKDPDQLRWFVGICKDLGVSSMASVFDCAAVEWLVSADVDFCKLAAREEANIALQYEVVKVTRGGLRYVTTMASTQSWARMAGVRHLGFFPLRTISQYPTPMWVAIRTLLFKPRDLRDWGWSSHTRGWLDCWLAARLGAAVIEKHLALSANEVEAGHSLLPEEFLRMTQVVRRA